MLTLVHYRSEPGSENVNKKTKVNPDFTAYCHQRLTEGADGKRCSTEMAHAHTHTHTHTHTLLSCDAVANDD